MKILHLSTYEKNGGAAIAANRLHKALVTYSVDSYLLVSSNVSNDNKVISTNIFSKTKIPLLSKISSYIRIIMDSLPQRLFYPTSKSYFSNNIVPNNILQIISDINPDIVHIHWINDGFFPLKLLPIINKPIVWSFHDMWAFTGGCHYNEDCTKWETECKKCPQLKSKRELDLSYYNFTRKSKYYEKINNLTIIGLSRWMRDCALNSPLLKKASIVSIANCLDLNNYFLYSKEEARKKLNLDNTRKIILFGAMAPTSEKRKGFDYLCKSLAFLKDRNDIQIIVIGDTTHFFNPTYHIRYWGRVADQNQMNLLYSAANVTISPSLQENLSNVMVESIASGTPVVAFDICGNKDIIDHKINGYLAKAFDSEDLANGIIWAIYNTDNKALSINSRMKAMTTFDTKVVVPQYIKLYKQIINGNKHAT